MAATQLYKRMALENFSGKWEFFFLFRLWFITLIKQGCSDYEAAHCSGGSQHCSSSLTLKRKPHSEKGPLFQPLSNSVTFGIPLFSDGGRWRWGGWELEVRNCLRRRRPHLGDGDGRLFCHHRQRWHYDYDQDHDHDHMLWPWPWPAGQWPWLWTWPWPWPGPLVIGQWTWPWPWLPGPWLYLMTNILKSR